MDNEKSGVVCNCKEIQEKLVCLLKDNGSLLEMLREIRVENDRLRNEVKLSNSGRAGIRPERTNPDEKSPEVKSLIEINHGWKKDYEELQMRYEMLAGEKKLIEEEEKELRERADELKRRQEPLENEIARLAGALYAQTTADTYGSHHSGSDNEQLTILKTQLAVYKEDFERERIDRERLHGEKEKLKSELEGAEEIIKKVTTELDSCKAMERVYVRPEDGYVNIREATAPRHQVQLVMPRYSTPMSHERWRYEQQRRGILPRNPPPTSFFYGGDVEVDSCSA